MVWKGSREPSQALSCGLIEIWVFPCGQDASEVLYRSSTLCPSYNNNTFASEKSQLFMWFPFTNMSICGGIA